MVKPSQTKGQGSLDEAAPRCQPPAREREGWGMDLWGQEGNHQLLYSRSLISTGPGAGVAASLSSSNTHLIAIVGVEGQVRMNRDAKVSNIKERKNMIKEGLGGCPGCHTASRVPTLGSDTGIHSLAPAFPLALLQLRGNRELRASNACSKPRQCWWCEELQGLR